MESLQGLDTHLATNSYLASQAHATVEDFKRCSSIKSVDIDAAKFPHLFRWHVHISQMLLKFGMFDAYGNPIASNVASQDPKPTKQQAQPKQVAAEKEIALEKKVTPLKKQSQGAQSQSRYVAILDFEKSLKEIVEDRGKVDKDYPCEIIEFPTVLVDLETGEIIGEIENIVKPKLEPQITVATTQLTSITQEEIDRDGVSFSEAFTKWHAKMVEWQQYSPLLATCGDMDIQRSFPQQLEHEVVAAKAGHQDAIDVQECFRMLQDVGGHRWCNIKEYFKTALGDQWETGLPWFDEAKGIREHLSQQSMLEALGMGHEGHHHRGIDDCRSLAKLMTGLYRESSKVLPEATGELKLKSLKALKK